MAEIPNLQGLKKLSSSVGVLHERKPYPEYRELKKNLSMVRLP